MKRSGTLWLRAGALIACIAAGVGIGLYARASMNVPIGIAYSGLLRNNGAVDSNAHTLAFDLLDGTGTPVCATDTRSNLTVTSGRFDVPDLFIACTELDNIIANKTGLQIRITVDSMVLSPNQPIGSVPFAARARVAESAESVSSVIPVANGGTGSATQNFVDLTTNQSVMGNKSFSGTTTVASAVANTSLNIVAAGGLLGNGVPGMIFGGMFCTDNAGTPGTSPGGEMTVHVNPLTNALSCPAGFTAYHLFETGDVATCSSTCGGFKCYYCGR
jgi:hypothetical protein